MTPASAIALSGIAAATLKLEISASNAANAGDVTAPGGPASFSPLATVQSPVPGGGVAARAVTLNGASYLVLDPASVLAGGQGWVLTPEIDPITEVENQLQAGQAFASSLKALQTASDMEQQAIDLKA